MNLNPQLLSIFESCVDSIENLLSLLDSDKDDMPYCIGGEILTEYISSTDEAIKLARAIKDYLVVLQAKQMIGL